MRPQRDTFFWLARPGRHLRSINRKKKNLDFRVAIVTSDVHNVAVKVRQSRR
jgi:hypothetical protein